MFELKEQGDDLRYAVGQSERHVDARSPDYRALVARIKEVIPEVIPQGAIVAVVSKGDPELVALPGRQAWHFPRDASGRYAGHYPPDGRAAVEHLEHLRTAGARFVVFPATSRWWLDHDRYSQLGEHLERQGVVLLDQADVCVVYALFRPTPYGTPEQDPPAGPQSIGSGAILGQQAMDLVQRGVPPQATVIALTDAFPHCQVLPAGHRLFGLGQGRTDTELLTELAGLAAGGAAFFVLPANKKWRLNQLPLLCEYLEAHGTIVLEHRHVCTVVEVASRGPDTSGRFEANGR